MDQVSILQIKRTAPFKHSSLYMYLRSTVFFLMEIVYAEKYLQKTNVPLQKFAIFQKLFQSESCHTSSSVILLFCIKKPYLLLRSLLMNYLDLVRNCTACRNFHMISTEAEEQKLQNWFHFHFRNQNDQVKLIAQRRL